MKFLALAVLTLTLAAALPASAGSITTTWNFATAPNQSLGTSTYAYTSNGITITAISNTNLFYKVSGGDETGLGLDNCPRHSCDHEIEPGEAITFDLSSLFSKNVTGISLMLGSIQPGETGSVCDAFSVCMTFTSSNDFTSTSILSLYADMKAHNSGSLIITSGSGDVLVNQLQVTTSTVPEPSSAHGIRTSRHGWYDPPQTQALTRLLEIAPEQPTAAAGASTPRAPELPS